MTLVQKTIILCFGVFAYRIYYGFYIPLPMKINITSMDALGFNLLIVPSYVYCKIIKVLAYYWLILVIGVSGFSTASQRPALSPRCRRFSFKSNFLHQFQKK